MSGADSKDVVAWQMRTIDDPEGFGMWQNCSADNAKILSDPIYAEQWEVRALVPERTLVELSNRWISNYELAQQKYTSLLSRIGELADEMEAESAEPGLSGDEIDKILTVSMDHTLRDCAKQLRTLASTATDGELK